MRFVVLRFSVEQLLELQHFVAVLCCLDEFQFAGRLCHPTARAFDGLFELWTRHVAHYRLGNERGFGRVAAQTAKQVLLQKLREFERETMANEYGNKIGKIITGTVIRVESRVIRLDLGHGEGIMPGSEQIPGEHLVTGSRIRALLKNIDRDSNRGPTIILSRADAQFVKLLFLQEVPEIETGTVEIKAIAREAGRRTKIAVYSSSSDIDPVGTFVGTKGVRVQAVMNEIGDTEKIDIITYDHDIRNYIANALSPAEISRIDVNESDKTATVYVTEAQQSVAIGRQGQNVRLASQLTGYDIDIVTE